MATEETARRLLGSLRDSQSGNPLIDEAASVIEDLLDRLWAAGVAGRLVAGAFAPHSISVLDVEWEPCGPPEDPALQLHTQVTICGVPMHLEAYAVVTRDGIQQAADPTFADDLDRMTEISGSDGPFHTVVLDPIDGPEYVLVAFPHAR